MKKSTTLALAMSLAAISASAAVEVNFAGTNLQPQVMVTSVPISDLNKRGAENNVKTYNIENGKVKFELDPTTPCMYAIEGIDNASEDVINLAEFYAQPGEDIYVTVSIGQGGNYTFNATGTDLMDGISAMSQFVQPIENNFALLRMGLPVLEQDEIEEALKMYSTAHKTYIDINPDNPAAAYAMLNIVDDDEFMSYLDKLGDKAKASIMYPLVEKRIESIKESKAAEQRMEAMQSGNIEAPNFTLPNQKGKKVSLSQFKGKWVVLDFWGTWCGWCVKGIPAMKEAYAKHKGKVEFISIDCGDTKEDWLAGLKKYQMPWVHVYAEPKSAEYSKLTQDYGIQGFPTKIIISPEGKIAKVVVGESPEFYTALDELVK